MPDRYSLYQLEGTLKLEEVAEGGKYSTTLCLDVKTLWNKDHNAGPCPNSLPFSLSLPFTFTDDKAEYALPPSYQVNLDGVPGFFASIDYSVSAVVNKRNLKSYFGLSNT